MAGACENTKVGPQAEDTSAMCCEPKGIGFDSFPRITSTSVEMLKIVWTAKNTLPVVTDDEENIQTQDETYDWNRINLHITDTILVGIPGGPSSEREVIPSNNSGNDVRDGFYRRSNDKSLHNLADVWLWRAPPYPASSSISDPVSCRVISSSFRPCIELTASPSLDVLWGPSLRSISSGMTHSAPVPKWPGRTKVGNIGETGDGGPRYLFGEAEVCGSATARVCAKARGHIELASWGWGCFKMTGGDTNDGELVEMEPVSTVFNTMLGRFSDRTESSARLRSFAPLYNWRDAIHERWCALCMLTIW